MSLNRPANLHLIEVQQQRHGMEFGDVHGRLFCDPDLQDLDAVVEIIALVVSDVGTATESAKVLGIVIGMSKRIGFFLLLYLGCLHVRK